MTLRSDTRRLAAMLAVLLLAGCASPTKFVAESRTSAHLEDNYRYPNTVDVGDVDAENMARAYVGFRGAVEAGATRMTFRINSMGGEIFLGLKWIQMITDLKKARGVWTVCVVDGAAYSMAAVILESPVCDVRLATPSSTILFHNARGTGEGTAESLEQAANMLEAMNQALAFLVADRLRIPPAMYRARIAGRDWVMAVGEALANHVIDAVVPSADIAPPVDG